MIKELLNGYLRIFPDEAEDLKDAINLANQEMSSDLEITNRKNFTGHFTASSFIICPKEKKILLLEHKSLNKLLQPGGHIEEYDKTPLDAALRELKEETGQNPDNFTYIQVDPENYLIPFRVDSHPIPENSKKHEGAHIHHDFGYLFVSDCIKEIKIDQNESNGFRWIDLEVFYELPTFKKISSKVQNFLAKYHV